jgi:hypothetical protein
MLLSIYEFSYYGLELQTILIDREHDSRLIGATESVPFSILKWTKVLHNNCGISKKK